MKFLKILFLFFVFVIIQQHPCKAQTQEECFETFVNLIGQNDIVDDYAISSICKLDSVECDITSTSIQGLYLVQTSSSPISNELTCFKNLERFSLTNAVLSDDFLTNDNLFPNNNFEITLNSPIKFKIPKANEVFSSKILSLSLYISTPYQDLSLVSLSYPLDIFNRIQNVKFIDLSGGNQIITFTEASKENSLYKNISLFSLDLPLLGLMSNVQSLSVDLQKDFSVSSIVNYYTYTSILNSLEIKAYKNQDKCFSSEVIKGNGKMKISKLKLSICLTSSVDTIDLAENYESLTHADIKIYTFKDPQLFPFSSVPASLSNFKLSETTFNSLSSAFSVLSTVENVDLSDNQISDQVLPKFPNPNTHNIKTLDLSRNKLTGSLDQSFCKIPNLIISNNQLEGDLDYCYLCYMKDPIISNNLANNSFSNLNLIQNSCFGKVIPRLVLDQSSGIIYMKGLNLGFNGSKISTNPSLSWNLQQASTSYSAFFPFKNNRQLFTIKYEIPSLEFTLRATQIQFIVTEYTSFSENSTIIFKGTDFTYDISLVSIQVGSYDCKTISATFSTLVCFLINSASDPIDIDDIGQLDDLITTITILNPDDNSKFILQLTTSFALDNPLTVQVTPCPNLCNGNGICYSNGQCKCTVPITYDVDCKIGKNCSHPCGLGNCDYSTGNCACPSNWGGSSCSTPHHYIGSIDPCTVKGGNVIIHGWFSDLNNDLTIKIGSLDCQKKSVNVTTIECILGPGSGTKDVNITQNGFSVYSKNKFQYLNSIQTCPNNCTSSTHGICDTSTGICNCNDNWIGFDCSLVKPKTDSGGSNSTVNNNGTTTINNSGDIYEISILSLVELDVNGKEVKSYSLNHKNNSQWSISQVKNIYKFSQKLNNSECLVSYSIEEVLQETKEFEFAGIKFNVDKGGIKLAVNVSNYEYTSSLNTLQLRIQSEAKDNQESSDCNKEKLESDVSNVDANFIMNYITLKKNNKVFTGRFINKAISDNRITYMSTEVVKELSNSTNLVIGLNLPHGVELSCDPDFSLLLSSKYKSKCDEPRPNWFLPVVIAVPIGGLAIITIASVILIKKYKYSIKLLMTSSIKLKDMKK